MTQLAEPERAVLRGPASWRVRALGWIDRPRPERDRRGELLVRLARLVATGVVVGLAAVVVLRPRSSVLRIRTDIMGYSVAHGFSPTPYERTFLGAIALVVVALCVHAALGLLPWLRTGRRSLAVGLGPDLRSDPAPSELGAGRAGRHLGLASLPLVVEAALVGGLDGAAFLAVVVAVPVVVGVAMWVVAARSESLRRRAPVVALVASLVAVAGLAAVSAGSYVSTTHGHRRVDWFPWWLALLAVAVAAGVVWLRHRGRPLDAPRLSGDVVVGVVGPVVLVLFASRLVGMLGLVDLFHEGENLVPATLMRQGALPWRDFLSIHGLLQDVGWSLPGLVWIENSRWGAFAGQWIWLLPAYWLAHYVLAAWLFRTRRWVIALFVLIVAAGPALAGGSLVADQFRMLLQPLILVAFGAVLARPSWSRCGALAGLMVLDLVVTPESALVLLPIAVLVVGHALERWWREGSTDWRGVVRTATCGVAALGAFAVYLWATGSFSGMVDWVTTFAVDHTLTGSRPVEWELGTRFSVEVWLTAGIPLAMIAYAVVRRRVVGTLRTRDWVMAAAAVGALGYYPKFLARPDFHIEHVWPLVVPIGLYLAVEAIDVLDRLVRRGVARRGRSAPRWLRPVAALAVVGLFAPSAVDVVDRLELGAERFRPVVGPTVDVQRIGYFNGEGGLTQGVVDRIDRAVTAAGGRSHGFFDFTNSPALFHYMLGIPAVSPFYDISMAIPADTQREVIRDLERTSPQVVAWSAPEPFFGLPSWDGVSNPVRHYLVAEWILDHYVPYVKVAGYGIWVRRDARASLPDPATLHPDLDTDQVDTQAPPCDWGRAPRFLDQQPTPGSLRTPVTLRLEPAQGVVVRGWAGTSTAAATRVLVVAGGRVVAETRPTGSRPDVVLARGGGNSSPLGHSGFEIFVDRTDLDLTTMQVVAVDRSGNGTVLAGSPGVDLAPPRLPGVRIVDGAVGGSVDGYPSVEGGGRSLYRATLPAGAAAASNWIAFDGDAPGDEPFAVAATPGDERQEITGMLMAGKPTTQYVRVGACSQWRSVHRDVYVVVGSGYRIGSVRLYR